MATQFDVWFRTDVNHYMNWVKRPAFAYRFPLHPATLFVLKPYSLIVGRFLPLDATILPLFALPVIVFNSAVITAALRRLASGWGLVATLIIALLIGPLLLLAPIPESHTMGGVSLLMEAVLIFSSITDESKKNQRGIILWGIASTGFSLSNLVPALLIAYPLWCGLRLTKRQVVWGIGTVGTVAFLGLAQFGVKYVWEHHTENFLVFVFSRFARWLQIPDLTAVLRSFRALVMAQFGVPATSPFAYTSDSGFAYSGVILKDAPNIIQILAALLWLAGITLWYLRVRQQKHNVYERIFTLGSLMALFWLIFFHCFFAADEAFMFSVHAWPFVLLPGLIAGCEALQKRFIPSIFLLGGAVLLSLIQTILALPALFHLSV